MLDGLNVVNAVVTAFQSIPTLVTAMDGSASRIASFHFLYGTDVPLRTAIARMLSPSVLIWWEGSRKGSLDGMSTWDHELGGAYRIANTAGEGPPTAPSTVFVTMMNSAITAPVSGPSIRKVRLLSNLHLMMTPSSVHRVDENGLDYFEIRMVFPEWGDA